jgi:hypothetical protein
MIGIHKTSWHTMLFSTLWVYRTFIKSATGFTHFQLVYGVESILPIECEIPSLKLIVELLPNTSAEEECLLYLMRLDETRCDTTLIIEARRNVSRHSMASMSSLMFSLKVILFFFMNKIEMC